jgi:MFS family permease
MEAEGRVFSKDYILAAITSVLLRLVVQYKVTLIPIYMLSLGMSKIQAGSAMTVFTFFALLSRPLSGNLIERSGRKTMLFAGIFLFALTTFPFGWIRNLYLLYLLQAVSGLSFSIQTVALTTIVTDIVPENKLTEGLGYFGLTASITQALGPALAVWSIGWTGYPLLFLYAGLSLVFALSSLNFITYERFAGSTPLDPGSQEIPEQGERSFLDRLVERRALLPSLLIGCLSVTTASTTSFLVPYAQAESINGIGLYFIARAVGLALSRIFAGRLCANIKRNVLLDLGVWGIIIGISGLSFFRSTSLLIVIAFLYGMGFGLSHVILNVWAVIETPRHRRAFANATFYLAMDAGIGIGSIVWGAIGDVAGMSSIFISAGIFTTAVFVWYKLLRIK